jgi:predicted CXXCH cytochrome family protein
VNSKQAVHPRRLSILLFGLALLLLPWHGAAAQNSCTSSGCHDSLLKLKDVHAATDSCDSCHESVSTPHPQKGVKTFKLSQEPPGLCYGCHDEFGKKSDVHPPVKDGMCTTCHDPHASNEDKLLAAPLKDLCESCHDDKASAHVLHGPVSAGDCTACHTPHESDIKPLLLKKEDELCQGCHLDIQKLLTEADVHPALEGGCTSCHNPHGSEHPKLLPAEGPEVCFQCHGDIEDKVGKSPVAHPPVRSEKGCATCHSPHASDNAKLLLVPEKDTCLACHKAIVTSAMTTVHAPVRDGHCTACHDPHGGENTKLLVAEFPSGPYAPYTDQEFALCFTCHKREMLQYPDTSFATGFRDGERNLHYLHVNNKQKGRSCTLCHNVHGGANPKLIADSVPFGKWNLPLKFVKTETGGSCAPGCHKPRSYDRKSPGQKPEAGKPAAKPAPKSPAKPA